MALLQELFTDLQSYYIHNSSVLGNHNFIRTNDSVSWRNHEARPFDGDYLLYYRWVVEYLQYSFQFEDGSCVQLYYRVMDDKLSNGSLAFIPSPLAAEDGGLIYFRFDCDVVAQRDYQHTTYHAHFGRPDTNSRVTLPRFPKPSDFMRFVMLVAYDKVDRHKASFPKEVLDLDELACRYSHCLVLK